MSRILLLFAVALTVAAVTAAAEIAPGKRRSDTEALSAETRAMQSDDTANPGMLAVLDGSELWITPPTASARSCEGCHGAIGTMRGVAARFPAWNAARSAPLDLAGQVNLCRTERQGSPPFAPEGRELLALTTALGHASRGVPIAPPNGAGMQASRERGRLLFGRRMGQLNLSCANCHDDHWGRNLAGTTIPQGHPVGYPVYRLEWQATGSLQRRFRNCLTGVRAEPFPFGAAELVDLEAYLMGRAAGLAIETPAVRP